MGDETEGEIERAGIKHEDNRQGVETVSEIQYMQDDTDQRGWGSPQPLVQS